jgi:hypothetical protein
VAPLADQNDLSDDVAAWIDRFDRGMSLLLPLAEKPPSELASACQARTTSAEDLHRVGDFLKKFAEVVEIRTPALEAA